MFFLPKLITITMCCYELFSLGTLFVDADVVVVVVVAIVVVYNV